MWSLESVSKLFLYGVPVWFAFVFVGLIVLYSFARFYNTSYEAHQRNINDAVGWCTFWGKFFLWWSTVTIILYGIKG